MKMSCEDGVRLVSISGPIRLICSVEKALLQGLALE